MKRFLLTLAAVMAFAAWHPAMAPAAEPKNAKVYELRTYFANPGKLDALHARFRDHTCKIFARHGLTSVAYWVPLENPDRKLIYILEFPSRAAREEAWKAFAADPDWKTARADSEKDGPLVSRVESIFLQATDFSPATVSSSDTPRIFEMRTYTATEGHLPALLARFRDHTCKLFEKHGITNVAYFTRMPDQPQANRTLVYFLAHASAGAAHTSFDAFRQDPDWIAARKASEEKAGGSLTIEGGVKSVFLQPTDYSPLK